MQIATPLSTVELADICLYMSACLCAFVCVVVAIIKLVQLGIDHSRPTVIQ